MKQLATILCALIALPSIPSVAHGDSQTLESVRDRGTLICGVNPNQIGMAVQRESGAWDGMVIDLCRAFAAATLGDENAVEFVPVTARTRFRALQSGEIDILLRTTAWTQDRDTGQGIDFVATYFLETESVLVRTSSGITSFDQLDGQSICIISGSRTETVLRSRQETAGIAIDYVPVADTEEYESAYRAGRCAGVADGQAGLTALRANLGTSNDHIFIEDALALSPLSIAVRHGDDRWEDIIRWTYFALLDAERLGVTHINASRLAEGSRNLVVRRIFSADGGSGAALGLESDWALRAVLAVGNYGEIYDRHFGPDSPLPIERDRNRRMEDGGMLFAAPFE